MNPAQFHKDTLYCKNPPAHSERELYKFEIPETVFSIFSGEMLPSGIERKNRGQNKNQVDTEIITMNT
jgi:hypothetical protein